MIVIGVCANPEPDDIAFVAFDPERAIAKPDACGAIPPDLLEMQRRVSWIRFQKHEIPVGNATDVLRQTMIGVPEGGVGEMPHRGLLRPAR